MPSGFTVLTIDDDKFVRGVIKNALEPDCDVIEAESGPAGLELAKTKDPDIVILDVEMPGMNGYEVCDHLKHMDETKDIPVIFLSSLSNLRSRMQGYEVGGADFLVKPFDEPEVKAKIKNLINISHSNAMLKEQVDTASVAAYSAMKGSSELGLAIQFVEHIFTARSVDVIAKRFFNATSTLGLRCNLMFVDDGERSYFDDVGKQCRPLEIEVMSTIFDKGQRIVDFGNRTQINYPHVAILVKNMPLDDMEAYGRIKDLLPAMLGATDAKVSTIEIEHAIANQTKQLSDAFSSVQATLTDVGTAMEQNQNRVIAVLSSVLLEMEEKLPTMGLEEDQEKYIISQLDGSLVAAQDLVENGERSKESFQKVIRVLQVLAERQKDLAEQVQYQSDTEDNDASSSGTSDDELTGEVELF